MPLWRSARVTEHLLTGATIALAFESARRLGLRVDRLPRVVRWWHARLCHILDMRIETTGHPSRGCLFVANHVSWLDIPIIGAQSPVGFLSKAEIRRWPLVGWMASIAGTLFLPRGANQVGKMIGIIEKRLRNGHGVVVFPEGTTTDGTRLLRFHPRLFAVGQCAGIRVQPVAIRFGTNSSPDPNAPFIGDDAFLPHLANVISKPGMRVQLHFLPPLDGAELSRREIAEYCGSQIAAVLEIEQVPASLPLGADHASEQYASPPEAMVH